MSRQQEFVISLSFGQHSRLEKLQKWRQTKLDQCRVLQAKYETAPYNWRSDQMKAKDYARKVKVHQQALDALSAIFDGGNWK